MPESAMNIIRHLSEAKIEADCAMMVALDRVEELEGLLRRLDWPNIHTHYGLTTNCGDCQIYLSLVSVSSGVVRTVTRDDEPVRQFHCPGCGQWADIDDDQFHGRVSIDCPDCEFHETLDLS
jgi:hypothetical protein